HTHDTAGGLVNQPVRVLIDLARQLDMHPADLIAGLEPVRANRRESASCEPDAGPDHDALTVLTCPLPHRQGRGYPVIWSWRCRTAS
ncbi:MAG TPA: hypothetical protein VGP57_13385, partial [Actinoplanes sp.]|nr:hypothetical protein [Actinoplanes sp.]